MLLSFTLFGLGFSGDCKAGSYDELLFNIVSVIGNAITIAVMLNCYY